MTRQQTPSIPSRVLIGTAARNLARHRRRTIINAASVAVTTAILAFFMGYYRGTYEELLYSAVIDYQTSHVQVQTSGFDEAEADTYAKSANLLQNWRGLLERVRDVPGVVEAAPRLLLAGFAGDGREKLPVLLTGVAPAAERTVGMASRSIVAGEDLGPTGSILLGQSLASLFRLSPGSRCIVQTWTTTGAPNIQDFTVSGIYRTGFAPLDRSAAYVTLEDAQTLADAGDGINKIFVKCTDVRMAETALPAIEALARQAGHTARSWRSYAAGLLRHTRRETYFYYLFLAILFALSISTIASTMYVSVFERTREIGSLRAIGWRRGEIFRLFVLESAAVGALGGAVGVLLGGAASLALWAFPIDLGSMSSGVGIPFFAITSAPAAVDFAASAAAGVACAVLAGTSPARRAASIDVVKALSTH